MRTLEEMKRDRGGHCHRCGTNIMSPIHEDHTFCNNCWNAMMQHKYDEWIDEQGSALGCNYCEKPKDDPIHIKGKE